jgi:MerR family transcriptional regulator/heat shock protein HspR
MSERPQVSAAKGVYGISVAADLVGISIPALRLYEARRLLSPQRTEGGTRRYSQDDLDRLRHIRDLLEAGLNIAGVEAVLALEDENQELRDENDAHRRRGHAAGRAAANDV